MNENVSKSSRTSDFVLRLLLLSGILLALLGVGIDYVLPNTSPGLNLPQLLVIAAGLALALGAHQLRREELRRRLSAGIGRTIAIAFVISLTTLVILEIVLAISGMSTYFPISLPELRVSPVNWWTCDVPGCHYIYDNVNAACEDGSLSGRYCTVNRQGYASSQDFVAPDSYEETVRILVLGDSFTFGSSAALGQSFVETLESGFPEAMIWNTGISGTGTNQAIASFKYFAPQLRPQLTVLGFHMNDFADNLFPVDSWFRVLDPDNRPASVRFYFFDTWGNIFKSNLEIAMRYFGHTVGPPRNGFEHSIGTTRLGTLLLRLRDALGTLSGSILAKQTSATREYLAELRDLASAQDSSLLVLLIPRREDVDVHGERYQLSIQLLEEVGIPHLNPIQVLDALADYAVPPDGHWNSAGHQKVGALLSDCIEVFIASGNLRDCENVVTSGPRRQ